MRLLLPCLCVLVLGCDGGPKAEPAPAPAPVTASALSPAPALGAPEDAVLTDTGLAYKVMKSGQGPRPKPHDMVELHFRRFDVKGALLENSRDRGHTSNVRVDATMPGWAQVLPQMQQGETRRLWIPEALGFRSRSKAHRGPLVYELDLIKIRPGRAPRPAPKDVAAAPADAERTPSGLVHRLLKSGKGGAPHQTTDLLSVRYVGWKADGSMIDDTLAQDPAAIRLGRDGFPGWREALMLLREGETRRFWIPEKLAYGSYPGVHRGDLVYDIELVSVARRPVPPVPDNVAAAPKDALRSSAGTAYQVITRGKGKAIKQGKVKLAAHMSSWTLKGELVTSTLVAGQPSPLKLYKLKPALSSVIVGMKPGEKRRFWLNEDQIYEGHKNGRDLCYELTLVRFQ